MSYNVSAESSSSRGLRQLIKNLLRSVIPGRFLTERAVMRRLEPNAARIYLRLRLLDFCGIRRENGRTMPSAARSILFVCFGNIMRSPAAEFMLKRALLESGVQDIVVRSAGVHAVNGREADPRTLAAARELGLHLDYHRASQLTPQMMAQADAVFAMDFQNKAELSARFPEAAAKVFMFSAYADAKQRGREIPDPFYADQAEARRCYAVLQTCARNLARSLASSGTPVESRKSVEA